MLLELKVWFQCVPILQCNALVTNFAAFYQQTKPSVAYISVCMHACIAYTYRHMHVHSHTHAQNTRTRLVRQKVLLAS